MARDNKVNMPSSGAGITRYFEDSKSKIRVKPGHVVIFSIIIMIIVLLMHVYGDSLLGII